MNIRESPDKHQLMEIYEVVVKEGGFTKVTANCGWKELQATIE